MNQPYIKPRYVPDLFKAVVAKASTALGMTVFFDAGHYLEICKNLQAKDGGTKTPTRTKYPLVWLVMDFEETMDNRAFYAALNRVQIIIAQESNPEFTMDERRDKSFVPVLYRIYAELLTQLNLSRDFSLQLSNGLRTLSHSKFDRPYWGGQENGDGQENLFGDYIDAIQIKNLSINVQNLSC